MRKRVWMFLLAIGLGMTAVPVWAQEAEIPVLAEEAAENWQGEVKAFDEIVRADALERMIYSGQPLNETIEKAIHLTDRDSGEAYTGGYEVSYLDENGKDIASVEDAGAYTVVIKSEDPTCPGEIYLPLQVEPARQCAEVDAAQVRGLQNRTTLNRDCVLRLTFAFPDRVKGLTFQSSDPSVASVTQDGVIRYHKVGKAVIWITTEDVLPNIEGCTSEVEVCVTKPGKPSFTPTPKRNGFVATSSTVRGAQGWEVRFSRWETMEKATTLTYENVGTRLYRQFNPTIFGGKQYYAQVRCFADAGGERVYSSWSEIKSFVTSEPFSKVVKAEALKSPVYSGLSLNKTLEKAIHLTDRDSGKTYTGSYTVTYLDGKGKRVSTVKDAGKYTVVITSKDLACPGEIQLPLQVKPCDINDAISYISEDVRDVSPYTGEPVELTWTIHRKVAGKPVLLVRGKDYRMEYENNINANVGDFGRKEQARAYIVGINNYCGKHMREFGIVPGYQSIKVDPAQVRGLQNRTTMNRDCTLRLSFAFPDHVKGLRFRSSDPSIASVTQDGVIRYHDVGQCVIEITTEDAPPNVTGTTREVEVYVLKPGKPSFTPTPKEKGFVVTSSTVRGAVTWEVKFSRFKDMRGCVFMDFQNVGNRLYRQTIPTLFSGKKYYACVRCYAEGGWRGKSSSWSEVKSFVTK